MGKDVELLIVADESLHTIKNAYGGANKKHKDLLNMNLGRDYKPDITADIALTKEGYMAADGSGPLKAKRGIEVGNIFQLGFYYSSKMKGADFIDKNGKPQPYYMGCYGIGLGRTLAAIVEVFHDDKGIIWPEAVAPYSVHLVGLDLADEQVREEAEKVYKLLQAEGIEVLFDDREEVSAGSKFADTDLIGIPFRVVISKKTKERLEVKRRSEKETSFLDLQDFLKEVKN